MTLTGLAAALAAQGLAPAAEPGTDLAAYRWEARRVVVLAEDESDPRLAQQIRRVDAARSRSAPRS